MCGRGTLDKSLEEGLLISRLRLMGIQNLQKLRRDRGQHAHDPPTPSRGRYEKHWQVPSLQKTGLWWPSTDRTWRWKSGSKNWMGRTNNTGTGRAAKRVRRQRHPEEDRLDFVRPRNHSGTPCRRNPIEGKTSTSVAVQLSGWDCSRVSDPVG